jgi:hypothetical protein
MSTHAEETIDINNVLILFNKECDCELQDDDECLELVSVQDALVTGPPICKVCSKPYEWDDRAIISKPS